MTIYQMFELCQIEVPQAGETLILELLNEKIKEFCHRTEIYKVQDDLGIVADTVEYVLTDEFPDMDGAMVKDVFFKDSNGEFVTELKTLKYTINNGVIRFYDYRGDSITAIPSEIAEITFVYVAIPKTKVITDTLTEIDSQFHEQVRSGVMEKLYKLYPTLAKKFPDGSSAIIKDISMIQLSNSEFERGILRGTRFTNSSQSMVKEIFNKGF